MPDLERNSDGERLYFDTNDNRHNIRGMIQCEPEWVASRFDRMMDDIERLTQEKQQAIDNANIRDQKWMAGIREACKAPIEFDVDPSDSMPLTLDRFIEQLKTNIEQSQYDMQTLRTQHGIAVDNLHAALKEVQRLENQNSSMVQQRDFLSQEVKRHKDQATTAKAEVGRLQGENLAAIKHHAAQVERIRDLQTACDAAIADSAAMRESVIDATDFVREMARLGNDAVDRLLARLQRVASIPRPGAAILDKIRIADLIDALRKNEGSSVEVLSENAEAFENPHAVAVFDDWTDWSDARFSGPTLLKALESALAEKANRSEEADAGTRRRGE